MDVGIILSRKCEQHGLLINEMVRKAGMPYLEVEDYPVHFTDSDLPNKDAYIALSIHSMVDRPRCICLHACGNWGGLWYKGDIHLGGTKGMLCAHDPSLFRYLFLELKGRSALACIEATHHGPDLSTPIFSLEIGSGPSSWQDPELNSIVFDVVSSLSAYRPCDGEASLVVGGDHYMGHVEHRLDEGFLTHMCPSSEVHNFTEGSLYQIMEGTSMPVTSALVSRSAAGRHHDRIVKLLRARNLKIVEV